MNKCNQVVTNTLGFALIGTLTVSAAVGCAMGLLVRYILITTI